MIYTGLIEDINRDSRLQDVGRYRYIGSVRNNKRTDYVFRCNVCLFDVELFGESLFYTDKQKYLKGGLFCGCAGKVIWTEQQAAIKSQRAAKNAGHTFCGIIQPYIGSSSRCNLSCTKCNHTWSLELSMLWNAERGCIKCRDVKGMAAARKFNIKPDRIMIQSFMDSGVFGDTTEFKRISRTTKKGQCVYWEVKCANCGDTYESQQGHLQKGKVGCSCAFHRQKEAYINLMYDDQIPVAMKFGISKNSNNRIIQHNYNSQYRHELFAIYKYETVADCKAAERKCKDIIPRGLPEMDTSESGWSEICYTIYLDQVMNIFSTMGGVRVL